VLLVEPQSLDERSDFVRLGVDVRRASDSVERDESESTGAFLVHDLDELLSCDIVVNDDVEETEWKESSKVSSARYEFRDM